MIVLGLIQNICLLMAFMMLHQMLMRRWERAGTLSLFIFGVLSGSICIIGMMTPLHFAPGVIFDGRSIILSVSALFGGPIVAVTAALIAIVYRLSLGGAGAWVGVSAIISSALLGAICHRYRKEDSRLSKPLWLLLFGLLVHVVMLGLMLGLPGGSKWDVLRFLSGPILVVYPFATMLISLVFVDRENRERSDEALRQSLKTSDDIVRSIPAGLFIYQHEEPDRLVLISGNVEAERLTGVNIEELKGKEFNEIWPEARSLGITDKYLEALRTGVTYDADSLHYDDGNVTGAFRIRAFAMPGDRLAVAFEDVSGQKRAENALRESEEKYRLLLEHSSDFIWSINAEGIFTYISPSWVRSLGYTPDDLVGKSFIPLVHKHDVHACIDYLTELVRDKTPRQSPEYRVRLADGSWQWHIAAGTPVLDEQGEFVSLVGVSRDISQRKHEMIMQSARINLLQFEATHTWEELLRETLDTIGELVESPIGFYHRLENDEKTIVLQMWSTKTLQGMCSIEGKGQHYDVEKAGVWVDCIRERRPVIHNDYMSLQHRRGMPEGHAPIIRELVVPIFRDDRIVGIIGLGNKTSDYDEFDVKTVSELIDLAWDISERKRAEEAQRETADYLDNLITHANAPIIVWDPSFRIVRFNRAFETLTGRSASEVIGSSLEVLFPSDLVESSMNLIKRTLSGERWETVEIRIRHIDGGVRTVLWNSATLFAADGSTPVATIAQGQDITERKQAEAALKAAYNKLDALWSISSLTNADTKTVSDHILVSITKMTDSHYGFYGFINDDESEMTIHAWSGNAMKDCSMVDKPSCFQISEAGVWGEAIRGREALVINDYNAPHPAKKGLPSGHSPLRNLLVVPYFAQGRITSVAAVANKSTDYGPEDISQITAFLASVQAITEGKRAEEALRISEERYRTVAEFTYDWEYWLGTDGGFLYCSPACERITGYSVSDFEREPALLVGIVHEEDQGRFVCHVESSTLPGGVADELEYRIITRTGEVRWIAHACRCVYGQDGEYLGRRASNRDITDRKQMEQTQLFLLQCGIQPGKMDFFEALAEYLARTMRMDYVCIDRLEGDGLTAQTLAIYYDGSFEPNETYKLRDTPCGDVVGREVCCFPENVVELFPNDAALKLIGAESYVGATLWSSLGKPIGLIALISRRKLKEANLAGSLLKLVAMRAGGELERRMAEEEQIRLREQLTQAQKMESVGRLAGGIAHDFNNLLAVILGYAELLRDEARETGEDAGHVNEIITAGERAKDLVWQLLAFSRKQTLEMKTVDMNATVLNIEKMLKRIIGENIEIVISVHLDALYVKADSTQLQQVLMNLCVNARDAMPNGGTLCVQTGLTYLDEDYARLHPGILSGEHAVLMVADSGHGMDEETTRQIFDPFFTTKERDKGTGLGLATVHGIVKQHRGEIEVSSEPGKGTTFRVFLPLTEAEVGKEIHGEEGLLKGFGEVVLLVEDEESVRHLVSIILTSLNYHVIEVSNFAECLRAAQNEERIDLLMTDVIMPEVNGREVHDRMNVLRPGIKTLFMSGYTADTIAQHGVLEDNMHFVHKPFNAATLSRKIREALEG